MTFAPGAVSVSHTPITCRRISDVDYDGSDSAQSHGHVIFHVLEKIKPKSTNTAVSAHRTRKRFDDVTKFYSEEIYKIVTDSGMTKTTYNIICKHCHDV